MFNTVTGKLGNMVLYRAGGEQRERTYLSKINNPKTDGQMGQRTQLSNIVNTYRVLRSLMQKAFENKKTNQSDYNKFVSLNLNRVPLYLTKDQAASGIAFPAPYQVTEGTLRSIQLSEVNQNLQTDLVYKGAISASTTVGQFSTQLITDNPQIQEGMQLSYVVMDVSIVVTGGTGGAALMEVVMNKTSSEPLSQYLPTGSISVVSGYIVGSYVFYGSNSWQSAIMCLSQKLSGGKLQVSSQTLVLRNYAAYEVMASEDARQTATRSYGGTGNVFLVPTRQVEAPLPTISSATVNGAALPAKGAGVKTYSEADKFVFTGTRLSDDMRVAWTREVPEAEAFEASISVESSSGGSATATQITCGPVVDVSNVVHVWVFTAGGNLIYSYSWA